ncbi:nucleotide sugar dehydrogenase [Bradyrhizobium amphicarpaeae]|uniref:UDP-glucose 6-dehydrogenase n=1 Tax=Bradyrhizobium amphicarpaeae TaxID=1404768 RepID=A0A2U8PPE8_9BRAD|nr:nucleotide sugar dehydrogenase [Bradyrhizobium amphicarpaeae]AWL99658.1 nucleotide sugar dehydrogenase [Bradyrhizobium amphicarpaeae]
MKVAIFGLGYVGLTAACCLSKEGHSVLGFDVSATKVQNINMGICPIIEPGLDDLLRNGISAGLISAYTEIGARLADREAAIVCVGTPSGVDGAHDMRFIAEVSRQIAAHVDHNRATPLAVVYRSTVRPGTMEELVAPIFQAALGPHFNNAVELVYNPEFLRESSAIADYFAPPKIVIGTSNGQSSNAMEALYARIKAPRFVTHFAEAEITKLVDNTWHAVKVSFANEIGRLCLQLGVNPETAHKIFISDTKLNLSAYYLRPGGAFGGSCLPKDVRALQSISADCGANTPLIDSLMRSNEAHKFRLLQLATDGLPPGASILLAGVAFKTGTDDLRESPNVDLARALLRGGYRLAIFDPTVDAHKLVGANLGYAWSHLPQLASLLVSRDEAETRHFDRVIAANGTASQLRLPANQDLVDLTNLAKTGSEHHVEHAA